MSDEELEGNKEPELSAYLIKSNTDFKDEFMSMMASRTRMIHESLNM